MTIDNIKNQLPETAKDIKLNLGSLSTIDNLPNEQRYGTMIASALASGNKLVSDAIIASAQADGIDEAVISAAQGANSLMAMNNIYYRAMHFTGDSDYMKMPANLRMNFMKDPGVAKADFELFSLAVSAINGCEFCVKAHEKSLLKEGMDKAQIQQSLRIAAIIHAVAKSL